MVEAASSASSATARATRPGTARSFAERRRRRARPRAREAPARPRTCRACSSARSELIGATRMRPFESIDELGVYLRLLTDLRDTLDKFQPAVFDRSLSELIAATAPRRDAPEMSGANRRRLKKLAQGVRASRRARRRPARGAHAHPAAAHALAALRRRRRHARGAGRHRRRAGRLPAGRAGPRSARRPARPRHARDAARRACRSHELAELLAGLAADSEVLHNLQERTALIADAARPGARRRSSTDLAAPPRARGAGRRRARARLVAVGARVAARRPTAPCSARTPTCSTGSRPTSGSSTRRTPPAARSCSRWQLAENWKIGLVDWPDEAAALKRAAARRRAHLRDAARRAAPHLSRTVAPVWLASPYEVDADHRHDAVRHRVLVDAGATTLAENVGAIRRARQVVAFGDPVTQTPVAVRASRVERPGAPRPLQRRTRGTTLDAAARATPRSRTLADACCRP